MTKHTVYVIEVSGVIRYVGLTKCLSTRIGQHMREAKGGNSGFVSRKLRSALKSSEPIRARALFENLSLTQAQRIEIRTIAKFGGHWQRGRQLWNTHPGGLGGSSTNSSKAVRKKWKDPAFRSKMSKLASVQIAEQRKSTDFEQKRIEGVKRYLASDTGRESLEKVRSHVDRKKQRKAVSRMMKRRWADPAYRRAKIAEFRRRRKQP